MRGIIGELDDVHTDVTVVDLEAGLEHLKRGTPRHTDVLLVVTEPYFRAAETARRTTALALDLGIPTVGVVANKVRDEREEASLRQIFSGTGAGIMAVVPYDEAVVEADRRPAALIDVDGTSPAAAAIAALASDLLTASAPAE